MGAGCVLLGLALQAGFSNVTVKLIIILGFLLITSPTAAHALVNGAYTHGLPPQIQNEEGES
jgi:multicomponent Na+:H+ antiporter subunit G